MCKYKYYVICVLHIFRGHVVKKLSTAIIYSIEVEQTNSKLKKEVFTQSILYSPIAYVFFRVRNTEIFPTSQLLSILQ